MEVLAMKRQIVLRIQTKGGNQEEYCIDINKYKWAEIIFEIFGREDLRRNKIRKEIILKSSDEDLVCQALSGITTYLTNTELYDLLERFKESEDVQLMVLWYCWDNKRIPIIQKLQKEGLNEKVREEANTFFEKK